MTDQELFSTVVTGIVAQGGPSANQQWAQFDDEWYPGLKGVDGRFGPAGHVLPAELVEAYPNENVYFLHRRGLLPVEFHGQYGLLRALENAHDEGFRNWVDRHEGPIPGADRHFLDLFITRCEKIAATYGLQMPDLFGDGERMAA